MKVFLVIAVIKVVDSEKSISIRRGADLASQPELKSLPKKEVKLL
jgi:hypothetical protein